MMRGRPACMGPRWPALPEHPSCIGMAVQAPPRARERSGAAGSQGFAMTAVTTQGVA